LIKLFRLSAGVSLSFCATMLSCFILTLVHNLLILHYVTPAIDATFLNNQRFSNLCVMLCNMQNWVMCSVSYHVCRSIHDDSEIIDCTACSAFSKLPRIFPEASVCSTELFCTADACETSIRMTTTRHPYKCKNKASRNS
jgi:hypothetical protein